MAETKVLEPGCSASVVAAIIGDEQEERLDRFLTRTFTAHSRTYFQELVKNGCVCINGSLEKRVSVSVRTGDTVDINVPVIEKKICDAEKIRALPVKVIHEHEHFLVLAKPAGLITHQASTQSDTISLADWITFHYSDIACTFDAGSELGESSGDRPGIVHRLDKDTSGLLVVARTQYAYKQFIDLFKTRTIKKTYHALVEGNPAESGAIDFHIERHPTIPTRMAYRLGSGREAHTEYTVIEYFKNQALLELKPLTGRTHQIRVHCMAIGHPVVGDAVYGHTSPLIRRQALHAARLVFDFDGQTYEFKQELPADFQEALKRVRNPHVHR